MAVDVEAVAAPAGAALLVALFGVRWVFWFDASTYLVSALLVAFASLPFVKRAQTPLSLRAFMSEVTTGTRILLREPSLRQALTLSLAEATAGAAAIVVTVVYVRDVKTMIAFTPHHSFTTVFTTLAHRTSFLQVGRVCSALSQSALR